MKNLLGIFNNKKVYISEEEKKDKPSLCKKSRKSATYIHNKNHATNLKSYTPQNDSEQRLIIRTKRVLNSSNNKLTKKLLVKLGNIKGRCHNNPRISYKCELCIKSLMHKKFPRIWNKLRYKRLMYEYLKDHPFCEICGYKKSKHIHHIIPVSEGGKEVYDNYLAVCIPCHARLHPEYSNFILSTIYNRKSFQ